MKFKPVPMIQTRAMFTVAQQKVACPKCYAPAGFYCASPSGKKCDKPHGERIGAYAQEQTPGQLKAAHGIPMQSLFS